MQSPFPCQAVPELLPLPALPSSILSSSHPTTTHFQPHHHPQEPPTPQHMTCFFPSSAFIPFPLLTTTRSSKFIPIRKTQSFFLDLSLENLPWISAELFSFLYTFLSYIQRFFSDPGHPCKPTHPIHIVPLLVSFSKRCY